MSLLERHLEQISLSVESIATLPFPPPKIFTNALLSTPDITSLIRDTEPHERALFSVPPTSAPNTASTPYVEPGAQGKRRQTVFRVEEGEVTAGGGERRAPRRKTAVAAVLGPELHGEVRRTETAKGEVNVEVLLRGVEKLNGVYEVKGVDERVHSLRKRWLGLRERVEKCEIRVDRQTRELERLNGGWDSGGDEGDDDNIVGVEENFEITEEDLRREEEEIRELELKKMELEERVQGMERDLGGLLR